MRIVRVTKDRLYSEDRKRRRAFGSHEKSDGAAEKHGETERLYREK
jgi:hypothetical protein